MKNLRIPVGVILILVGLLWILQGTGVIGGSGMSGKAVWAVVGVILAALGAYLVAPALRGLRR